MSLKNKLNRLKPHLSLSSSNLTVNMEKNLDNTGLKEDIPYLIEWKKDYVSPFYFDGEYCLVREVRYPLTHTYGKYRFSDFIRAVEAWNHSSISHPLSSKGFKAEDLFFFDTETTGLGGGAGNTIFLLGHASVKGDQIVLKQHLLPKPGGEIPLYQSFLENVNYTTLVTYNGKAFDWPQVKTRHTLIRDHVPNLPSFGHFDLFHAARRLWKHKLERMKLSIVEKEVLNIERKDDVPGFLAPMIYFDFVERQNPEGIMGILRHNEMDILSLITLYTHLSFQLLNADQNQSVKERYEVGRWYAHLGENQTAMDVFSQISHGDEQDAVQAKLALSMEYKKQKEWKEAVELWTEVSNNGIALFAFDACIELAKVYEHKEKQLDRAHFYCQKAKALLATELEHLRHKYENEIDKRLLRIRRKLN
ncbi:ribonuclease H-like domain-containing protein [Cytobacillus sp. FJAT-54145]|uniref:Ribonuclease H-like domain-containing protein n=1 Tax=Cytobacillus spartinae TaxID=3299023 RepID=A0ABW6KG40_9BACI